MTSRIALVVFALLGSSAAYVLSQNEPAKGGTSPRNEPRAGESRASEASGSTNCFLASCLIQDNENEVALAEIAQGKASNESVKQFAKMMIQDHKAMIAKLQECAAGKTGTGAASSPSERSSTPSTPSERPRRPGEPTERADSPSRDPSKLPAEREASKGEGGTLSEICTIKEELGKQCLETAKRELGKKSGAEFDKCYMTAQVFVHMHAVDAITVFKNHATGQLQQTLAEALPKVQSHLEQAKNIAKQLEGGEVKITPASSREGKRQ